MVDQVGIQLERYMTLLAARQRIAATNIANADTPGYRTRDIDFQRELQSAMPARAVTTTEAHGLTTKSDGNNVSLDREARLLSENALKFNVASNLMRSQLNSVRAALREGRNS
jgi:flagellar basal-body rod protein FlgB